MCNVCYQAILNYDAWVICFKMHLNLLQFFRILQAFLQKPQCSCQVLQGMRRPLSLEPLTFLVLSYLGFGLHSLGGASRPALGAVTPFSHLLHPFSHDLFFPPLYPSPHSVAIFPTISAYILGRVDEPQDSDSFKIKHNLFWKRTETLKKVIRKLIPGILAGKDCFGP